jgi:hypothetical protein
MCPDSLSPDEIKLISTICFATESQIPSNLRGNTALVVVTKKPRASKVWESVQLFSKRFNLHNCGQHQFVHVMNQMQLPNALKNRGVGFRYSGNILVLAPAHEQGRYWRKLKASFHIEARIYARAFPGPITEDSWYENETTRELVWKEATLLFSLISQRELPQYKCDEFFDMMNAYLNIQKAECVS